MPNRPSRYRLPFWEQPERNRTPEERAAMVALMLALKSFGRKADDCSEFNP